MSIERSRDFILVGLFLSRCGHKVDEGKLASSRSIGNRVLGFGPTGSFSKRLGPGRCPRSFLNSLKAKRDQFDGHVDSGRRGWRVGDQPQPLPERDAHVLQEWGARTDSELWDAVRRFANLYVRVLPRSVLGDLQAELGSRRRRNGAPRSGR